MKHLILAGELVAKANINAARNLRQEYLRQAKKHLAQAKQTLNVHDPRILAEIQRVELEIHKLEQQFPEVSTLGDFNPNKGIGAVAGGRFKWLYLIVLLVAIGGGLLYFHWKHKKKLRKNPKCAIRCGRSGWEECLTCHQNTACNDCGTCRDSGCGSNKSEQAPGEVKIETSTEPKKEKPKKALPDKKAKKKKSDKQGKLFEEKDKEDFDH